LKTEHNTIIENTAAANSKYGVYVDFSSDNMIYHNNFGNNLVAQFRIDNGANTWDNDYPSGGNYWSGYTGVDLFSGPHQDIRGGDGIGDTPYGMVGNDKDNYPLMHPWIPPDLALNQLTVSSSLPIINIGVTVENKDYKTEAMNLKIYADSNVIWSQSTNLPPRSDTTFGIAWNTAGYIGCYQISAYVEPLDGELDVSNNRLTYGLVSITGMGYVIIVAGGLNSGAASDVINCGCNQAYNTLLDVGFSKDRIFYMNQEAYYPQDVDGDGNNDINALASDATLQWVIEVWARSRVNPTEPLFIYMFDHGSEDMFGIHGANSEWLQSTQFASWLDYLQTATGAPIHVICSACFSGSFIDDLSKPGNVIVTSTAPMQVGWTGTHGDIFSVPFWNEIRSGHSVEVSFNFASESVASLHFDQTPLLDDDGDGTGHVYPLPQDGDGYVAEAIYIGACEWPYPWISQVMPRLYSSWPPSNVTLWAKIENKTNLVHVQEWMVPPDWVPPNSNDTLIPLGVECFEMTDSDHDGNWTVNIPAVNFTNHATGPSNFTFYITAEEANGDIATPSVVTVQFTATSESPPDTVAPFVFVERPLENRVVCGDISVNGTVSDDVCLDRVEVYVDNALAGTVNLPLTSTSFFELPLDTTLIPNGNHTILANVFDKSGNWHNQTITFFVQNFVHDVAVTEVATVKTVIMKGYTSNMRVIVANHGSYPESFNLSMYAKETCIATQTVTLPSQNFTTLNFDWNTSGFAYGNYTISAYAEPVPNETSTSDNLYVGETVTITIPGDINADGIVDIYDAIRLAGAYNSVPGGPSWNSNADINGDNTIDIYDAIILANHYNQHNP
jgi:parallel beta-helix repeat protein